MESQDVHPSGSSTAFEQFLEFVPDAIVGVDRRGGIVLVNRQVEVMFGYRREQLLGRPLELLVPQRFKDRHLSGSESDLLRMAARVALSHHERFDGSGYPQGLVGEEIPLEARIVAVADVFDALLSDRVYRPAMGVEAASAIIRKGRGTHFDPAVVDALFEDLDAVLALRG